MICDRCGKPYGNGATRCWESPCIDLDCGREPITFEETLAFAQRYAGIVLGMGLLGLVLSGRAAPLIAKIKFETAAADAQRSAEITVPK